MIKEPKLFFSSSRPGLMPLPNFEIGFGCWQSSKPELIKTALNGGVKLFVTAEAYGDENQQILGQALKDVPDVFIMTKIGIDFKTEEKFTQSREQIRTSVNHCMQQLQRASLDFVALHRLDKRHWQDAIDELIQLQKKGLVKHIGLSEPTAEQLEEAILIAKQRGSRIDAIESAYSIVVRRAEKNGVKEICEREQIALIAYTSVGRKLMDPRLKKIKESDFELPTKAFKEKIFHLIEISGNVVLEHLDLFSEENFKHNIMQSIKFQQCAEKYQVTPAQLALAWVIFKGAIPVPGSTNVKHIEENNQAVALVETLQKKGAFIELDQLFPIDTFKGDPNPISISGVLDSNHSELNGERNMCCSITSPK